MKEIISILEKHNKEEEGEKKKKKEPYQGSIATTQKFNIGSQRAKERFLQNSKGT